MVAPPISPTMTTTPPKPHRIRRRLAGAAVAALAAAALAAAAPALGAGDDRVAMAKLVGGSGEANAQAVAHRTGLHLRTTIPEIGWAVYDLGADPAADRAALLRDPAVFRVDTMSRGETLAPQFIPRDTVWLTQGTVGLNGQAFDWNWHWLKTNFPAAWDISRGSASVRVAVIDSEFDTEHAELKTKLATGRNFDSGTPEYLTTNVRGTDPAQTHGTHVAGLIAAATDNGNGVSGACFDCVVIPYKIGTFPSLGGAPNVDSKFIADLTEALVEAGHSNAVAINMSLGTTRDHGPLRDAVNFARSTGKVIVASAGNSQQSQPGVKNYPAAYPGVIAVAATRPDDTIAPFSTNGDYVDVAAPGDPVFSTWDSRIPPGAPVKPPTHNQGFSAISGTSMASPITAGLVALMRTVRPDLTADEVEALLKASSADLGAAGPDPIFGAGRIDALKALQAAQAYVRPPSAGPPPGTVKPKVRFFLTCHVAGKEVKVNRKPFVRAPRGSRLVCTGRTQPALRLVLLEVQRFNTRAGFKRIGKLRTNNKGRFGFTRRLGTLGNWRIRVAYAGDASLAPSGSPSARVRTVRRR
jgi:subtilisin family serine protease